MEKSQALYEYDGLMYTPLCLVETHPKIAAEYLNMMAEQMAKKGRPQNGRKREAVETAGALPKRKKSD